MKRVALQSRSCFLKTKIKSIHAEYFHGRVYQSPAISDYLAVEHSANFIPNVFCPSFHWVICKEITKHFRELPEVMLREVRFERLFDLEMDFDIFPWDNLSNEAIYNSPTVQSPKQTGEYFEVIAPSPWKKVSDPNNCGARLYTFDDYGEIELPHLDGYYKPRPLIVSGTNLLMDPELFKPIEHFFDIRFFCLGEIEVEQ